MKTQGKHERAQMVGVEGRRSKAALARRGEQLVAEALTLKTQIAKDFWELGHLLATMRSESCHTALGFERFSDLTQARLEMGKTTTFKLIAVAEGLPQEEALRLGQEKAYALISYAAAGGDDPVSLAKADASVAGKPLSQSSAQELRAALRAMGRRRPKSLAEIGDDKAAAALVRNVKAKLKAVGLSGAAVTASRGTGLTIALSERQARRWVDA